MTPRQIVFAALLTASTVVLFLVGLRHERRLVGWQARARSAEAQVSTLQAQALAARQEASRWRTLADSLRARRDTLILTRWRTAIETTYAAIPTTLGACLADLTGLRTVCRQAVDSVGAELERSRTEANDYRTGLIAMTTSDSLRGVAVDSLQALVRAVPVPRKWFGFLPAPRVQVGLGCAGGQGFGCGVMAGVGFTF
ncbi:MAG: hypothetical protein OEW44_02320 [Gemmatimonadota bacterium]|nr:hypothetical protein [Gemmatimonadota bacterium]